MDLLAYALVYVIESRFITSCQIKFPLCFPKIAFISFFFTVDPQFLSMNIIVLDQLFLFCYELTISKLTFSN